MKFFPNMTLRARLVLSFSIVSFVTVVVGATGLWALAKTNSAYQTTTVEIMPALDALTRIERDMGRALVLERSLFFVNVVSPEAVAMIATHSENLKSISETWTYFLGLPVSNEAESAQRSAITQALNAWEKLTQEAVTVVKQNSPSARRDAIDISMNDGSGKFDVINKLVNELVL